MNNGLIATFRIVASLIVLVAAIYLLPIAISMIMFDRSELSSPTKKNEISLQLSDICDGWTNAVGVRQICRKFRANAVINLKGQLHSIEDKISAVEAVLEISPMEPAYWLELANLRLSNLEPLDGIVSAIRMSYLTGRGTQQISAKRFSLAFSLWSELEDADKSILLNDLQLLRGAEIENAIFQMADVAKSQRDEIIALLKLKNPMLAEVLRFEARMNLK